MGWKKREECKWTRAPGHRMICSYSDYGPGNTGGTDALSKLSGLLEKPDPCERESLRLVLPGWRKVIFSSPPSSVLSLHTRVCRESSKRQEAQRTQNLWAASSSVHKPGKLSCDPKQWLYLAAPVMQPTPVSHSGGDRMGSWEVR